MDIYETLKSYYRPKDKGESITWEQLQEANNCFIEHQEQAVLLIRYALGYTPQYRDYATLIPFLRTYLEQRRTKQISDEDFLTGISVVIKQIRNGQMQKENRTREFDGEDFEVYFRTGKEYKHKARKLLFDILGFETKTIHSLEAELILRLSYHFDNSIELDDFDSVTYYAATIALYRYNFMEHGEAAANDTPLLGLEIPFERKLAEA